VVFDSAIDRTLSPRKIFHLEMTSSVGLRSREVIETHAFAQDTNTNTTTTSNKQRKKAKIRKIPARRWVKLVYRGRLMIFLIFLLFCPSSSSFSLHHAHHIMLNLFTGGETGLLKGGFVCQLLLSFIRSTRDSNSVLV
jgi:hypothetical protein